MKFVLNHFKKSMQTKNGNVTGSRNNADVDTDFVIIYNVCFIDVILVTFLGIISNVVYCAEFEELCTFGGVSNVESSTFECMTGRSPADKSDHFLVMVDTSPCRPGEGGW